MELAANPAKQYDPVSFLGNLVRYTDYGRRNSPFGWELELIVPVRMGGAQDGENLQALHWKATAARSEAIPAGLLRGANVAAVSY